MGLAIFDLDNTLLDGDSDYLWGQFLVEQGIVDRDYYERENDRFYEEYRAGTLDIHEFLNFTLEPLARHDLETLQHWRELFMAEKIRPIILPKARKLLARHRHQGHRLLIITATNSFVTRPIADELGIEDLLATEPEMKDGRYSGRVAGTPCFREGKVLRLREWLQHTGQNLAQSWFYSDSHNDLPLLALVTHPTAVDPDETLAQHAEMKGWPVISLRA
ncbi:MAG: HAD family hydrolase [Gammaproteobacteria bacterium]